MAKVLRYYAARLTKFTDKGFSQLKLLTFRIEKPIMFSLLSIFSITASCSVSLK
ncbi:hypothetical protein GMMP1_130018 [Candidatus Magnetomoraceae bacterium gMMP-1]